MDALWSAGLLLVFLGVALSIVGILLMFLSSLRGSGSRAEGGAVFMIGPIPIVVGTSERAAFAALVLAILAIALMLLTFVIAIGWPR
ncbi:MAG: DUF131 domain-containing protein [Desulfurococcaceae archaeon]